MKTFLKVLVVVAMAVVFLSFLPEALAAGCLLGLGIGVLAALGVSFAALGGFIALAVVALLSPIWLPILALLGVIALLRKVARSGA